MAELFPGNPYPRILYRRAETKQVNNQLEYQAALADGWSDSYVYQEYPKMVNGQIVQNSQEEMRLLGASEAEAAVRANTGLHLEEIEALVEERRGKKR